jgi:hypothetical protein
MVKSIGAIDEMDGLRVRLFQWVHRASPPLLSRFLGVWGFSPVVGLDADKQRGRGP